MIRDSDERLELAKKFSCHHVIIDVCKQLVTMNNNFYDMNCVLCVDYF